MHTPRLSVSFLLASLSCAAIGQALFSSYPTQLETINTLGLRSAQANVHAIPLSKRSTCSSSSPCADGSCCSIYGYVVSFSDLYSLATTAIKNKTLTNVMMQTLRLERELLRVWELHIVSDSLGPILAYYVFAILYAFMQCE